MEYLANMIWLAERYIQSNSDDGYEVTLEYDYLKTVSIGTSSEVFGMMTLDGYAFHGCSNLEVVTLGKCFGVIEGNAFSYCEKLETISLSNGLTKIGESAFAFCKKLTTINFDGTSEQWINVDKWSWWDRETGDYEDYCSQ